jgi:DNA-binding transcriptional MocR family regulator
MRQLAGHSRTDSPSPRVGLPDRHPIGRDVSPKIPEISSGAAGAGVPWSAVVDLKLAPPLLSRYGMLSASPSPVARMMNDFATGFRPGVDVNLGVGYVNEETIPARQICRALRTVVESPEQYPHALNYGGSEGSARLIAALRRFLVRHGVGHLTRQLLERRHLIIGPSGVTSLLDGLARVLRPGIVVTGDPLYYIYSDCLSRLGFRLLPIPEDAEGLRTDLIESRVVPVLDEVSFFYVVTIGNPTSIILSNDRRRHLVSVVTRLSRLAGRQIPLVLDNAYELLIHDPATERPQAGTLLDTEGIVYELGTLSKVLAPALRIGYLLGPPGPLIDALVQRTNDVAFSAPLINQEVASELLDHEIDDHLRVVNAGYRNKALAVRAFIETELGDALEQVWGGRAGFYYYVTLGDIKTHRQSPFFRYASRTTGTAAVDGPADTLYPRVIYLPGELCVHPEGEFAERGRRQLRISYSYASLDELQHGVAVLGEAARYARGSG